MRNLALNFVPGAYRPFSDHYRQVQSYFSELRYWVRIYRLTRLPISLEIYNGIRVTTNQEIAWELNGEGNEEK